MSVYIQAAIKRELNARILADGAATVYVSRFDLSGESVCMLDSIPKGTAVKLYTERKGDSPYAKAYGTWNPVKLARANQLPKDHARPAIEHAGVVE